MLETRLGGVVGPTGRTGRVVIPSFCPTGDHLKTPIMTLKVDHSSMAGMGPSQDMVNKAMADIQVYLFVCRFSLSALLRTLCKTYVFKLPDHVFNLLSTTLSHLYFA